MQQRVAFSHAQAQSGGLA